MFHSNASPFNQRQPKAGPSALLSKPYEHSSRLPMDLTPKKSPATFKDDAVSSRPIITNSRVKKDETYRRDMYLAFINNALLQKSKGSSGQFDELVSQFSSFDMKKEDSTAVATSQLRLWLSALSHVVSQFERTHSALVNAIINMPWTTMDYNFVKSYISFIGMLVSARPEYLSLVLEKIARGMTFRSGVHAIELFSPGDFPLTRRIVYDRLHNLLEHLLSLIPTLPSTLQPLLVRNFPHKRQDRADQEIYIRNLLRITEYCPALSDRILATIIDRAMQIDVEIQVEMEELEADDGGRDGGAVFMLDPFDTVVGQEGSDSDEEDDGDTDGDLSDLSSDAEGDLNDMDAPEVRQDLSHVREMVAKLDGILKLLFDYFNRINGALPTIIRSTSTLHEPPNDTAFTSTSSPARPPSTTSVSAELGREIRRAQFIALLSIFDRIIIRTFKSRYTQFLVFWYSSLDPEFTDMFQGLLVSKALFEEAQPIVTRAAAASYIASFVSRAQFVDAANARLVIGLLCDFLQAHLDMCAALGENFDPNSSHHTVFYAVVQAVFLIFCFRWRDLHLEENELDDLTIEPIVQKKWISKLDVVQRAITSELNPLKVCSANVVHQFARIARSTGFVYCYTIIENNKRASSRSSGNMSPVKSLSSRTSHSVVTRDTLEADLNTFFPFDPYKLPMSYSYIQGVYREWASVALQEDEDEDDEEVEEEEEENIGELPASSQPWHIEGADDDDGTAALGASFGGMSISPIRLSLVDTTS